MNHKNMQWFLAGAATMMLIVAAFYFVVIAPLQSNIEKSINSIIAQRDAALLENRQLRAQLHIRKWDVEPSFPSPVTQ